MELIFAAALCSVAVSILLKVAKNKGLSPIHMISWNYMTASLLCFFWFKPDIQHISMSQTPWLLILALGILLPSIFLFLAKALQTAGILKTEIAQRLSVVLSLAAAYFIFQEQFNQLKILGIALGIGAVLCILFSHRQSTGQGSQGMLYLGLVWVGYALIDVLLKYTIKYKSLGSIQNIGAGLLLGVLNFANIAFYVKAHMLLKDSPAIVFAGMNILVVVLGVIAGVMFFKERLKPASAAGLLLGLTSVICLAYAMSA